VPLILDCEAAVAKSDWGLPEISRHAAVVAESAMKESAKMVMKKSAMKKIATQAVAKKIVTQAVLKKKSAKDAPMEKTEKQAPLRKKAVQQIPMKKAVKQIPMKKSAVSPMQNATPQSVKEVKSVNAQRQVVSSKESAVEKKAMAASQRVEKKAVAASQRVEKKAVAASQRSSCSTATPSSSSRVSTSSSASLSSAKVSASSSKASLPSSSTAGQHCSHPYAAARVPRPKYYLPVAPTLYGDSGAYHDHPKSTANIRPLNRLPANHAEVAPHPADRESWHDAQKWVPRVLTIKERKRTTKMLEKANEQSKGKNRLFFEDDNWRNYKTLFVLYKESTTSLSSSADSTGSRIMTSTMQDTTNRNSTRISRSKSSKTETEILSCPLQIPTVRTWHLCDTYKNFNEANPYYAGRSSYACDENHEPEGDNNSPQGDENHANITIPMFPKLLGFGGHVRFMADMKKKIEDRMECLKKDGKALHYIILEDLWKVETVLGDLWKVETVAASQQGDCKKGDSQQAVADQGDSQQAVSQPSSSQKFESQPSSSDQETSWVL